jgi:hypothetical protein
MALRDPKRKDPEIRPNLDEVREEARDVSMWTLFQEEFWGWGSGKIFSGFIGPPIFVDRFAST